MLENLFFNDRRYDLARVGRYKLNERLHRDEAEEARSTKRSKATREFSGNSSEANARATVDRPTPRSRAT